MGYKGRGKGKSYKNREEGLGRELKVSMMRVKEWGKLYINRNEKKMVLKWVINWIFFNIFQEVKLVMRIALNFFIFLTEGVRIFFSH